MPQKINIHIPSCHECNGCGKGESCFAGIPDDKECWEVKGSLGGDKTCALFHDMKLTDCKNCFFYKLKMKATETVDMLKQIQNEWRNNQ